MTNQDMAIAIRTIVGSSSNMMLDKRFQNEESAKIILDNFLVNLSKKTGVSVENILGNYIDIMCETKANNTATPKLRYGTAFDNETYNKLDQLIMQGYTNKAIAGILNINPTTVSRRRSKLRNYI